MSIGTGLLRLLDFYGFPCLFFFFFFFRSFLDERDRFPSPSSVRSFCLLKSVINEIRSVCDLHWVEEGMFVSDPSLESKGGSNSTLLRRVVGDHDLPNHSLFRESRGDTCSSLFRGDEDVTVTSDVPL